MHLLKTFQYKELCLRFDPDEASSYSDGKFSTDYFLTVLERFHNSKNKASTKNNYYGIWTNFNKFVIKLDSIPQKWEDKLKLYCVHLVHDRHVQSSTLKSYVTAIKQTLTSDGYQWNNKLFLLSTFVNTCEIENDRVTSRLPISR